MAENTWPADEIAWARECFHAGDTFEEIAGAAGCTVADVRRVLGSGRNITERGREVLSLYSSGCSLIEIGQELGISAAAVHERLSYMRHKGVPIPFQRGGDGG
jgi:DNA-binding NarL/FixJ family response regulator